MANATPDFVQVRLTAAAQKLAADGPFTYTGGRAGRSFTFHGSDALKVEKSYEWTRLLARHTAPNGDALFELVPDEPAANA